MRFSAFVALFVATFVASFSFTRAETDAFNDHPYDNTRVARRLPTENPASIEQLTGKLKSALPLSATQETELLSSKQTQEVTEKIIEFKAKNNLEQPIHTHKVEHPNGELKNGQQPASTREVDPVDLLKKEPIPSQETTHTHEVDPANPHGAEPIPGEQKPQTRDVEDENPKNIREGEGVHSTPPNVILDPKMNLVHLKGYVSTLKSKDQEKVESTFNLRALASGDPSEISKLMQKAFKEKPLWRKVLHWVGVSIGAVSFGIIVIYIIMAALKPKSHPPPAKHDEGVGSTTPDGA